MISLIILQSASNFHHGHIVHMVKRRKFLPKMQFFPQEKDDILYYHKH